MTVYGLVDCNNFYVSCERVFNPKLEGRPAIVLSSNDGCAIARSAEAKELGVKMAQPLFQFMDLVKQHDKRALKIGSLGVADLKTQDPACTLLTAPKCEN